MMNRHITQWHKPAECNAACFRVEKIMRKLKELVKEMDNDEEFHGDGSHEGWSKPPEHSRNRKEPHIRFNDDMGRSMAHTNQHPQCRCEKRNGLQDYCGEIGHSCYMRPKALCGFKQTDDHHQYEKDEYSQRQSFQMFDPERLRTDKHFNIPAACTNIPEGVNDFYLIPVKKEENYH